MRYFKKAFIGFYLAIALILISNGSAQQKKPEVPFVPTPNEVVAEMLRMANVGKDDVLYDLGCGDGRIVITAVKKFGCRGVGVDIDPNRIKECRENAREAGVSDSVQFILMDLFEVDLSEATVVTLYLLPQVNIRLRPKLLRELNPGTRVVSHEFNMGDWESDATSEMETEDYRDLYQEDPWDLNFFYDSIRHLVFFWIIPGDAKGTWTITIPDTAVKNQITLNLDQEFQKIKGNALAGAIPLHLIIQDNKINGDKLRFTIERNAAEHTERMHFEGIVKGDIMTGTLKIENTPGKEKIKEAKWTAKCNSRKPRK